MLLNLSSNQGRLLVFACHEAWIYQLKMLDRPMDIVVGLRGRPGGWDERMRPVPRNARLVHLNEALASRERYDCIIAHNLTDLLESKALAFPRVLVVHETLDGAALEQKLSVPVEQFRETATRYVQLSRTHVVAVSQLKGRSWGFDQDIVPFSADIAEYSPAKRNLARGLRVANHILRRPQILMWDFHQKAFGDLPITLAGHNPGLEGVQPAANWDHLKDIFSSHRFYIHTADPRLEDGYNMATLEAMAAGLPVVGNRHPTSPVEHGVSGFLSNDPGELREFALRLLHDPALASQMGDAARKAVQNRFSPERFQKAFTRSIDLAREVWRQGHASQGPEHQLRFAPSLLR